MGAALARAAGSALGPRSPTLPYPVGGWRQRARASPFHLTPRRPRRAASGRREHAPQALRRSSASGCSAPRPERRRCHHLMAWSEPPASAAKPSRPLGALWSVADLVARSRRCRCGRRLAGPSASVATLSRRHGRWASRRACVQRRAGLRRRRLTHTAAQARSAPIFQCLSCRRRLRLRLSDRRDSLAGSPARARCIAAETVLQSDDRRGSSVLRHARASARGRPRGVSRSACSLPGGRAERSSSAKPVRPRRRDNVVRLVTLARWLHAPSRCTRATRLVSRARASSRLVGLYSAPAARLVSVGKRDARSPERTLVLVSVGRTAGAPRSPGQRRSLRGDPRPPT